MVNMRRIQLSFAGGEVSPEMLGRIDDVKYQSGLAKCRNFVVKPQGPVENRAGFQFVREVKNSSQKVRLINFTYSTTQTMVIELGAGYFRFHTQGATLMNGSVPYEISNTYAEKDLFDIHYVQSADVLTLVHPNYPPMELRRLGATQWELKPITFGAQITPPENVTAVAEGSVANPDRGYNYYYVVTAVASGKNESVMSVPAYTSGNVFATGQWNRISWNAVTGASYYNIYKLQGGIYGYIGQTQHTTIVDDNIAPDLSITPPMYDTVFNSAGNYPGAVSYFEQRRCFAGTSAQPQNLWMTRSGTESVMSYSMPTRDDDRIAFRVAAREANTIRHIVPLAQLLLLTSSAEWRVTSVNSDAITPGTTSVSPQSYVGASNVQPVIINNTLIYGAARGGHVRELAYNWQASGFVTGDLSLRATHLFDTHELIDMAYAKAPYPIVWFVSSNGRLLGFTYVPEQEVGAWHWHDTDGVFESCTVVAEGKEDVLYCAIRREVGGKTVRYIERMASRLFAQPEEAFFVDAGLTYKGEAASQISGLAHLEGKTVSILADGAVHPQCVVTDGAIELDHPASIVHVGLPIQAEIQTLPFSAQVDNAYGQARFKNVNEVWLRVFRSSGIFIGFDENNLVEAKQRTTEVYGAPPKLKSEEIRLSITPSWNDAGSVLIRQVDPLPLTAVNMTIDVALGS